MSGAAKNRVKSSWTPLNNEEANQKWKQFPTAKIFEERRALVGKWFDKWTDGQRKLVLNDLLERCKVKQVEFAGEIVQRRRPIQHDDFTRSLPRVLSLYVFSFLDPRSLCRCSQVCWFWKNLTELDQLWMAKCVKLGWVLSFAPSPYEVGVWKRLYIENIQALKCLTPKRAVLMQETKSTKATDLDPETSRSERADSRMSRTPRKSQGDGRPPWRGSDPVPKDIWRNNILENEDETEKVNRLRKRAAYGKEIAEFGRVTQKINSNLHPTKRPSSVPRSRSVPGLSETMGNSQRPDWAKKMMNGTSPLKDQSNSAQTNGTAQNGLSLGDANKRPAPVKTIKIVSKPPHRTPRDPPSSNLFPEQPWKVPAEEEYDSDLY